LNYSLNHNIVSFSSNSNIILKREKGKDRGAGRGVFGETLLKMLITLKRKE
jgi:hypothetical protein